MFDADANTDLVVQLFDSQGRVVAVDFFGNVVDIGQQATTDTFVIPLNKHPTADRIVIRRVEGGLRLNGIVLYPIVTEGEGEMDQAALRSLANSLGDPLSPENPLVPSIQKIAKTSQVEVAPVKTITTGTTSTGKTHPPAAPVVTANVPAAPVDGLLAHLSFDNGDASDSGPRGSHGQVIAGASFVSTERGMALHLNRSKLPAGGFRARTGDAIVIPPERSPKLSDRPSLCAWVRYRSLPKAFGSQLIWHGDSRPGLDPWTLYLLPNGRAEFRSDRSVTGRPTFFVSKNEIQLTPAGEKRPTQHIGVHSPLPLEPGRWYHVVGTMDMLSARTRTMRLYINGTLVSEIQTTEAVEYSTEGMWTTIGAVEKGGWQTLDGEIDDVRIYGRAISSQEVLALYSQQWK